MSYGMGYLRDFNLGLTDPVGRISPLARLADQVKPPTTQTAGQIATNKPGPQFTGYNPWQFGMEQPPVDTLQTSPGYPQLPPAYQDPSLNPGGPGNPWTEPRPPAEIDIGDQPPPTGGGLNQVKDVLTQPVVQPPPPPPTTSQPVAKHPPPNAPGSDYPSYLQAGNEFMSEGQASMVAQNNAQGQYNVDGVWYKAGSQQEAQDIVNQAKAYKPPLATEASIYSYGQYGVSPSDVIANPPFEGETQPQYEQRLRSGQFGSGTVSSAAAAWKDPAAQRWAMESTLVKDPNKWQAYQNDISAVQKAGTEFNWQGYQPTEAPVVTAPDPSIEANFIAQVNALMSNKDALFEKLRQDGDYVAYQNAMDADSRALNELYANKPAFACGGSVEADDWLAQRLSGL